MRGQWRLVVAVAAIGASGASAPVRVAARVDASQHHQRIDGFGVNVAPAQWRNGALGPTLDGLAGDLGASLVRLDCFGRADWLDPSAAGPDGTWPAGYLARVYGSQPFSDCWAVFRHLTAAGVDVHLNVSGRVPRAWNGPDGRTLADFDAYAEMVVSLARWARHEEGLRFSLLAPFNETDIGPPEGPAIRSEDVPKAVAAVLRRMPAAGLGDVRLVVMCDANAGPVERYRPLLEDPTLAARVAVFSAHTYGDGDEQDAAATWFDQERPTARFVKAIAGSANRGAAAWMTEYGDLDQSGVIEWQFAWRSTRRLLKALEDGFRAAFAWDAYDNLHEHDAAWARYGLLRTDRSTWTYTPRKRYYAARQVFRFVRPGWSRVAVVRPRPDKDDVYATWRDAGRHVRLLAFASADGTDLSLVAMNRAEAEVTLDLDLVGLAPQAGARPFASYVTSRTEDGRPVGEVRAQAGHLRVALPEASIVTLTTLRAASGLALEHRMPNARADPR